MIIYKDILTDDEVISDVYNLKEVDGVVYEADCKMVKVGNDNIDIGANPSAEEAEEGVEDTTAQVIDVVHSFRLQKTQFDKKQYLTHLKGYMKAVVKKLEESGADADKVKSFQTDAQAYAKKLIAMIKDIDFYTGESMNPDGMVVLLNYREDGVTPYVIVWKDGLTEMKV